MKSVIKTISSLGLALGLCSAAFAVSFTGQIGISGSTTLTFSTGSLLINATGANGTTGVVTLTEGSYPGTLFGDVATYKPFTFGVGPQAITNLWTVTDSGPGFIYGFNLTAITQYSNNGQNLSISGVGMLTSNNPGLDPTPGSWTYQITSADGTSTSGNWQFQSNNAANVPDGGSMVVLLGSALLGVVWVSRRLKSAA